MRWLKHLLCIMFGLNKYEHFHLNNEELWLTRLGFTYYKRVPRNFTNTQRASGIQFNAIYYHSQESIQRLTRKQLAITTRPRKLGSYSVAFSVDARPSPRTDVSLCLLRIPTRISWNFKIKYLRVPWHNSTISVTI